MPRALLDCSWKECWGRPILVHFDFKRTPLGSVQAIVRSWRTKWVKGVGLTWKKNPTTGSPFSSLLATYFCFLSKYFFQFHLEWERRLSGVFMDIQAQFWVQPIVVKGFYPIRVTCIITVKLLKTCCSAIMQVLQAAYGDHLIGIQAFSHCADTEK